MCRRSECPSLLKRTATRYDSQQISTKPKNVDFAKQLNYAFFGAALSSDFQCSPLNIPKKNANALSTGT